MTGLYELALADIRAIPTQQDAATPPEPGGPQACCTGDRPGYQWHQRSGNLPACTAALEANRAYMYRYQRDTRRTTRAARRKRAAS